MGGSDAKQRAALRERRPEGFFASFMAVEDAAVSMDASQGLYQSQSRWLSEFDVFESGDG